MRDPGRGQRALPPGCDAHAARTGKGASTTPEGVVYDTTGARPRVVAYLAWNGSAWCKPSRLWRPGDKPIYDPSAEVVR